jgi:hypothetical protein
MPLNISGSIVNSAIASTLNYKSVVTRGAVLNLDAGALDSYPQTGTTWFDLTTNANNGTLTNGPTFSSQFGGTISFDSSDDFVSVGNLGSGFSTFTVEIWFKSDSVSNYRNPIDCNWLVFPGGWSNVGPRLEQDSLGRLGWVVGSATDSVDYVGIDVTFGLSATPVHYAAITKTNSNTFLSYYNGNYVTSVTFAAWPGSMSSINIGRGFNTSSERWFLGNIPVVRIYNRALSSTEISQNFNSQRSRFGV